MHDTRRPSPPPTHARVGRIGQVGPVMAGTLAGGIRRF